MRIYIIAGEASGDLHGANLIRELKKQDPQLEIRAWGGDRMAAEGATIVKHIKDLAFMGFAEVVMNIKTIFSNISFCKDDLRRFNPDAVIFIDYPGFNLRIAPFAKKIGAKTLYYISPQIWAWKSNRVHDIKKYVDEMYTILPFEEAFYAKYQMPVTYVGHPLLDELARFQIDKIEKENVIALLPGSRKQEIEKMLPIMGAMKSRFPEYRFVIAAAPSIDDRLYKAIVSDDIELVRNDTYSLLAKAKLALVTSGTATLETALIGTPQVVCYKGSSVSYQIAKRLVKLNYISLVNLIMDKEVVKELIQSELNEKNLFIEMDKIINAPNYQANMIDNYSKLRELLGGEGASERCAHHMLKTLNSENKS